MNSKAVGTDFLSLAWLGCKSSLRPRQYPSKSAEQTILQDCQLDFYNSNKVDGLYKDCMAYVLNADFRQVSSL